MERAAFVEAVKGRLRDWKVGSWALGIGSALALAFVFALAFAYMAPASWGITAGVRHMLPLPVVVSGWRNVVSYRDLSFKLASVRQSFESQDFASVGLRVDFTTEDGKKRLKIRERELVNRALENEAMWRIATREGISITMRDARKAVEDELATVEDDTRDAAETRLFRRYGWTLDEYTGEVVLPSLYEERLREWFKNDPSRFAEARKKAEAAKSRLDDGRSFADVAAEFSEGRTAGDGGAMGWFGYETLDPSLRDPIRQQEVGVVGGILESDLGFHIVLVNGRKTEDGSDLVDLSQIFIVKQSFGDFLAEEMRSMPIRVLAPEYEWDREGARVEFGDPELRRFEEDFLRNSEGDASVVF